MPRQHKRRIFIGSSRERKRLAEAVQNNLQFDFSTKIWNQGVFGPSYYTLESLEEQLARSDFGIFILAPDDLCRMRGRQNFIPRDNVLFELGMFIGKLGRKRSFIVVPKNRRALHLPTDLSGFTPVVYDSRRDADNYEAMLGPASNQIRDAIKKLEAATPRKLVGFVGTAFFPDYAKRFEELLDRAREITLYFIHSRRWRENNNDKILRFIQRKKSKLLVILPDLTNPNLIKNIQGHFDDGPFIPGFIADAYRYFAAMQNAGRGTVEIRLSKIYPTYSFYLFDRKTAIVAMYPTTTLRKSVPTFEIEMKGEYGDFLSSDINQLKNESRAVNAKELLRFAKRYSSAEDVSGK